MQTTMAMDKVVIMEKSERNRSKKGNVGKDEKREKLLVEEKKRVEIGDMECTKHPKQGRRITG